LNSRQIEFQEGENLKKNYDIDLFMETSAKNGNNIEKLFGLTAKMIYEQYSEEQKISSVKFFLFF
jgi:hypothetical protein